MFRTLRKIFRVFFYLVLIVLGVVFSVGNHASIELTLFPLPYSLSFPVFLFAILVFLLGMTFGWAFARFKFFKIIRHHKKDLARIHALENELTAIRSERLIK
jgi:uncharacterized integral membrane protein